jgi:hypothetical protein
MKIDFNLPRNLRVMFGFLRGLFLVFAIIRLIFAVVYPAIHVPVPQKEMLTSVVVSVDPGAYRLTVMKSDAKGVELGSLRGTVQVDYASESADLTWLLRWRFIFGEGMRFGFVILLFDLLHRLCRSVERGEIFSERNTRLVRNLGFTILVYQGIGAAAGIWYTDIVDRFLSQHVVTEGLKIYACRSDEIFPVDSALIVTGFLVLLLAEVFRQGLALKKENDLTV